MNPHTEELRHAVLEILATRGQQTALRVDRIRSRVGTGQYLESKITDEDVGAALMFLAGLKLVDLFHDPLGSTQYAKATSEGVLAYERGSLRP